MSGSLRRAVSLGRHAARAVPWTVVVASSALVAGLVLLTAQRPSMLWPLFGTAVGLIVAATASAADEPAAAVVDTLPRGLVWRTAARFLVVPVVLVAWVGPVWAARSDLPDHLGLFVLQGVTAALVGIAVPMWLRARGSSEPGRVVATIAVPVAAALALMRPFTAHVPLFPIWPSENWARGTLLWSATAVAASVLVLSVATAPTVGRLRSRHR